MNVYSSRYGKHYGACALMRVRSDMAEYRLRIRVWRSHDGSPCMLPSLTRVRARLRGGGEMVGPLHMFAVSCGNEVDLRRTRTFSLYHLFYHGCGAPSAFDVVAYQILRG